MNTNFCSIYIYIYIYYYKGQNRYLISSAVGGSTIIITECIIFDV